MDVTMIGIRPDYELGLNVRMERVAPGNPLFRFGGEPIAVLRAQLDGHWLSFAGDFPTEDALRTARVPSGGYASCMAAALVKPGAAPIAWLACDVILHRHVGAIGRVPDLPVGAPRFPHDEFVGGEAPAEPGSS